MEIDAYKLTGEYWTRNFLLMGIPRSGTSLFVKMLNRINGLYCFNEIWYDVTTLAGFFTTTRKAIMDGQQVLNTFDNNGDYTEDTLLEENKQLETVEWQDGLVLGLKANETFMFQLDRLIYNCFLCFCLIRHPVYSIGSWNSDKAKDKLNAYSIETDERYIEFNFTGSKFNRQAQLWEMQSKKLLDFKDHLVIFKYEDWTADPKVALVEFAKEFQLVVPQVEPFENMNIDSRYNDLDRIRESVKKYCPSAKEWGYEI